MKRTGYTVREVKGVTVQSISLNTRGTGETGNGDAGSAGKERRAGV